MKHPILEDVLTAEVIPAFGALYDFVRPGNKMTIAEFINSLQEDHPVRKSADIMSFLTLWKEYVTSCNGRPFLVSRISPQRQC